MTAARTLGIGLPTAIGSLPHTDRDAAVAFVLETLSELPAAPSLPALDRRESMIAQAAWGLAGVVVAEDGTVRVDPCAMDPEAPIGDPGLADAPYVTLRAFLAAVAGRTQSVKLQLTGPVTLGLALHAAGAPADLAFRVAASAVAARAEHLLAAADESIPDAPLVVFLDEPGLAAGPRGDLPLGPEATVDLVSGALAALEVRATTGVHCCGMADWRLVLQAGPTVLSLPVEIPLDAAEGAVSAFVERGGWVAWGAVPTDRPLGGSASRLWRALSARWCGLVQAGCDPLRVRHQSLVTPACGLALHGEGQAAQVLALTRQVSDRVHDQMVGVRLSVGA